MLELPGTLVEQVRQGQVVLLLGAGASFGAEGPDGFGAPSGEELGILLSDQFLDGQYKDRPLASIGELAVSESDLLTVQQFLADLLRPLDPANFHLLIPRFPWFGIATTNYDLVLERAYEAQDDRIQQLALFYDDNDRVEDKTRSPDHVVAIKLHGCVTRISDPDLPLILTPDQYLTHRDQRQYPFELLTHWAREKTVVFVGQDLSDMDIRQILLHLEQKLEGFRPKYFLVRPSVGEAEKKLWERRKVDLLDASFKEFLVALDDAIPRDFRPLLREARHEHPVIRHFTEGTELSRTLRDALEGDLEYVHSAVKVSSGAATDFYKGFDLGWHPIVENLDLRRSLVDTLLLDVILADEQERGRTVEFVVVKGEAGAGKSVLLRRLAWEAAVEADRLTLRVRDNRQLRLEPIQELAALSQQRIFLFVDDVADHAISLDKLLYEAQRLELPITVVGAESYSLWDIYCTRLNDFVSEAHELQRLSEKEIGGLVDLLEEHGSLGARLERMTRVERIEEFKLVADRHLLVALHEATLGDPFEVILEREYRDLKPRAAQRLYLTVCVLNRLKVPVRAGLVSRVHGIPFEDFERDLLGPLDHVVRARMDPIVKDYMYEARHSEIADMVFRRVLADPEDRYREYSHLLKEMELSYRTDEKAFEGLMKGKSIVELFPDYDMGRQLYELAENVAPHSGELFHQKAIFEMRRSNPSAERAYEALQKAWDLGRDSPSITHTFAELALVQADATEAPVKKEHYWERAESLASSILSHARSGRYGRHTLVKVGISRLREALENGGRGEVVEETIANIEGHLERGYQNNPDDPFLTASEADFLELLREHEEAVGALREGFQKNPRDRYLATRLAKALEARGDREEALQVVETALKANRSDRRLNFRKAMLLRTLGEEDPEIMIYHLRRSFTPGDDNYEAQFWYARYLYEISDRERREEAKGIFEALRKARVPYEIRTEVRARIGGDDAPRRFHGAIRRLESTYGFVELDEQDDWVFVHSGDVTDEEWQMLRVGLRISCEVGFTMQGPVCLEIRKE